MKRTTFSARCVLGAVLLLGGLAACTKSGTGAPAPAPTPPEAYTVTTLAGGGQMEEADGTGAGARFFLPRALVIDSDGNLYTNGRYSLRKITPAGVVTTPAGGTQGYTDGRGPAARFFSIEALAIDRANHLYVADRYRLRRVTPAGEVTTLAGGEEIGFADGSGTAARFSFIRGLAVDAAGTVYVAESAENKAVIRKVTPAGVVSLYAGGEPGYKDGPAGEARFGLLSAMTIDKENNLYVADIGNSCIRRITPAGVVSTVVKTRIPPLHLALDGAGGFVLTEALNSSGSFAHQQRIFRIDADGVETAIAGRDESGFGDGGGSVARFFDPEGVVVSSEGRIYVADRGNNRIRVVTKN